MGVLETVSRIVQLGGASERRARVAEMRARFEERTGAFKPEDGWFEERSRAFWCDAVTTGRFGREVEAALDDEGRGWLGPLEHAHRGLFRAAAAAAAASAEAGAGHAGGQLLVDVWSGAELELTLVDDVSRAELDAAAGQLFDARVVGADEPFGVALLPGAVFHPPDAAAAIGPVLDAARARQMPTGDVLDALLRMEHTLRSLSRVKASYAYRVEALTPRIPTPPMLPVRRAPKAPT